MSYQPGIRYAYARHMYHAIVKHKNIFCYVICLPFAMRLHIHSPSTCVPPGRLAQRPPTQKRGHHGHNPPRSPKRSLKMACKIFSQAGKGIRQGYFPTYRPTSLEDSPKQPDLIQRGPATAKGHPEVHVRKPPQCISVKLKFFPVHPHGLLAKEFHRLLGRQPIQPVPVAPLPHPVGHFQEHRLDMRPPWKPTAPRKNAAST